MAMASRVHGYFAIALAMTALFFPAIVTSAFNQAGALVGIKMFTIAWSSDVGTLLALALMALGISHVHTAATSPKAAAGVVCSESSFAIALVVAGYLKKQPGFYLLAVLPAVFTIWAWMEMPAPAAKAASTTRAKAKSG